MNQDVGSAGITGRKGRLAPADLRPELVGQEVGFFGNGRLQCLLELSNRLIHPPFLQEGVAVKDAGLHVVGLQIHGFLEMSEGFVQPAFLRQQQPPG